MKDFSDDRGDSDTDDSNTEDTDDDREMGDDQIAKRSGEEAIIKAVREHANGDGVAKITDVVDSIPTPRRRHTKRSSA